LLESTDSKPWESSVINMAEVYKFNGYGDSKSLDFISDYMGLNKTERIMSNSELSNFFWENIKLEPEKTVEKIKLQGMNQNQLVFEFLNDMRKFRL
jgi:hypothetical protein